MIEYRLLRSDRRTLSISVDREGALVVHAPKRMSVKEIEAFLQQKQRWIREKQALVSQLAANRPLLAEGETIPFWGETLTIAFGDVPSTVQHHGQLILPRSGETVQHVRKWRLQQAEQLIVPRVRQWTVRTGLQPSKIAFGHAAARWGSMNHHTRSLRLNAALVHCPPELVDYVIVHELMHIRHPDHSPTFHADVRAVLPDEQARRNRLSSFAPLLRLEK